MMDTQLLISGVIFGLSIGSIFFLMAMFFRFVFFRGISKRFFNGKGAIFFFN